jgi:putative Ca2+/H+ antiporter (TMEM165/GDT1 family)
LNPLSGLSFGLDAALFWTTLGTIFLAELPDKTAFATVMLATRGKAWAVFAGVAAAFAVQSLVAILFGSLLGLLPRPVVRYTAGALFLAFAVLMWRRHGFEDEEQRIEGTRPGTPWRTVLASFAIIFIAEWGDLTQLATAALEAKARSPTTIFLAATLALWLVAGLAIFVGHHAKSHLDPKALQRVAAIAFALVGLLMLLGLFG